MTRILPFALLALAACQATTTPALIEADAEARAVTNECLVEIGRDALPEDADADAAIPLTVEEEAAYSTCIASRTTGA